MKKLQCILFIVVLAMIGATASFLLRVKGHQKLGNPGVKISNVPMFDPKTNRVAGTSVVLPENVLGYLSESFPVSEMELGMLPKDTTYGKRGYWMTNGANISLNVVVMGQDRTSIHKPEFCLVGQGWTIEKSEIVPIRMDQPYAYDLSAMKMTASTRIKDALGNPMALRGIYIYWFVTENKLTPSHEERMISMAKSLLRTGTLERWAYISYFSTCVPGQEEETFAEMKRFIAASAPQFQLAAGAPSEALSFVAPQTAFK